MSAFYKTSARTAYVGLHVLDTSMHYHVSLTISEAPKSFYMVNVHVSKELEIRHVTSFSGIFGEHGVDLFLCMLLENVCVQME